MKSRVASSMVVLGLFLTLFPAALASTTWYVDGVNGSDSNNCMSPTTACKTIGHTISLASSGVTGNHAIPLFAGGGLGGGIYNTGTLSIDHTEISGNSAKSSPGCRICFAGGGGIYNAANSTAIINNSTLNSNNTSGLMTSGSGVDNEGVLTINNSTINGNSTETSGGGAGGGVYNAGRVTISNSTISENGSPFGGDIANNSGSTTLQNSIVADSSSGGNCSGTMTSTGYNLSSDSTCNFNNTGDLNNIDPKLGPLQNNGGPTQTQALLPGSPAIDAGNPNGCTDHNGNLLKTDQRGARRPDQEDTGGCDMGAYERQTD